MTEVHAKIMKLVVEIDLEKTKIDKRIHNHKGSYLDMVELLIIKGGVVGKLGTLKEIMNSLKL